MRSTSRLQGGPAKRRPVITIVDWLTAPVSEPSSSVERSVIGRAAEIRYHRLLGDSEFRREIFDTDALILWHNIPVTAPCLRKFRHCKAIIRNGVGFDTVDVHAAAACGIPVCNVPDYGTEEVADHAITLALVQVRQVIPLNAVALNCGWAIPDMDKIRRLRELTFGIVGLGRIGTATALRAKAMGFKVVFFDPHLPSGVHKAIGVERAPSLEQLLGVADILSLHCPLNEETRHLIGRRELALLRPSAYVVNTARGAVIEKTALLAALRAGTLAGAALDVIENEPLKGAEEAATPNLIATCHSAFCSRESRVEMRRTSARIALAAVQGRPIENVVNG